MDPKISIIIPVYQVEEYLERCVQSALNQTLKDIEIILVDDGSPDRCPEMCDNYALRYDQVQVIHKKNGGLASARNAGMKLASGKYIFFMDSDDWLEPDGLELLYQTAEKYLVDFVRFRAIRSGWPGLPQDAPCMLGKEREIEGGYYDRSRIDQEITYRLIATPQMTLGPIVGVWESLYNRKFLDRHSITFYESIRYSEDIIFSAHVVDVAESFFYIEKPCVYHYFYNPDSISKSYRPGRWEACKQSIELFKQDFESRNPLYKRQIDILIWFYIFLSLNEKKYLTGKKRIELCRSIIKDETVREAALFIPGMKVSNKLRLQMLVIKLGMYRLMAKV